MARTSDRERRATASDIARRAGVDLAVVQEVFLAILAELHLGREVRIAGFGFFRRHWSPPRKLRTPVVPGGIAEVPGSWCVRFRRAPTSREKL
jgi:nucleoid DNA-binding protein